MVGAGLLLVWIRLCSIRLTNMLTIVLLVASIGWQEPQYVPGGIGGPKWDWFWSWGSGAAACPSWAALTNGQWAAMTDQQWVCMTN